MDIPTLVTTVGRCVILMAQLEDELQELAYRTPRGTTAAWSDVSGLSGKALTKQLRLSGLDAWADNYGQLAEDRNALVHSVWYRNAHNRDEMYARRGRQRGEGMWDSVASPWSDARFAGFVERVETALVDAVNDVWRAADLPASAVYTREYLPV